MTTAPRWIWRHPRPIGAEGRCIGARSDLAVDPRKAKRLGHRIRAFARRHGLPRAVACSPLRRCRAVGEWLRRWGFQLRIDERLRELDFGAWDGRPWHEIPQTEIDAWVSAFSAYRPGGGESLNDLFARLRSPGCALLVGHAGWITAARLGSPPESASAWPRPPRYGERVELRLGIP